MHNGPFNILGQVFVRFPSIYVQYQLKTSFPNLKLKTSYNGITLTGKGHFELFFFLLFFTQGIIIHDKSKDLYCNKKRTKLFTTNSIESTLFYKDHIHKFYKMQNISNLDTVIHFSSGFA